MFESIRSKEIQSLIRHLFRGSLDGQFQTVDMKSAFSELQLNIIMMIITGKRFYGDNMVELEETRKFRYIVTETFKLSGTIDIGDFVPALNWFGPTWTEKKLKVLREKRDKSLQQLIDERRRMRGDSCFEEGNKTLVHVLLSLQESEPECYTDETISGLMQVMIIAGTDTSSGIMEWALSLLLNNPAALDKACDEINRQIGHSRLMEDSDLSNLPYLHSIINETLRMCPAAAISPPHESSVDCNVGGFHVPRGTMLLVNLWAIQNDPKWWDEPTTFKPERFMDLEGQRDGFKFMPFGSRRRGEGLAMSEEMVDMSEG